MQSESARVTTAEESAFRVQYPNSQTRTSLVIVLDERSRHVLGETADLPWNGARFFTFAGTEPAPPAADPVPDRVAVDAVLRGLDGRPARLTEEIASAQQVVMITSAGESAEAAAAIGDICNARSVMTTGLILSERHDGADTSVTLRNLRPYAAMLVVASEEEYVPAMLAALRA